MEDKTAPKKLWEELAAALNQDVCRTKETTVKTQAHQEAINHAEQCGTNWCQQYALDCGWDLDAVKATAERGVSQYDLQELGEEAAAELVEWCREKLLNL